MSQQDQATLLQSVDVLDDLLRKSQIVQGGNSEVSEWAGSQHSNESIPSPAPDGTNYQPSQQIAHKSLQDCTNAELEHFIQMRKSGLPNFRAAEAEIEALEGVQKGFCPVCTGSGANALNKSRCGNCGGHGITFKYATQEAGVLAKAIADKYNCGPESLNKSGNKNTGGARSTSNPDASSVPTKMPAMEPVKTDDKGEKVAKGTVDEDGDYKDEVMKSLVSAMQQQNERLSRMEGLVGATAHTASQLAKSVIPQQQQQQQYQAPVPGRAPLAAGHGLRMVPQDPNQQGGTQVMAKSFAGGEQGYSPEDWKTLTKSATQLVYEGKLEPGVVLKMESKSMPDPQVMAMIQSRANGGQQQFQQ